MAMIDLEKMLDKVRGSQWALVDIDWDAPGAELITAEQWPKLRDFMIDLVWIEHVGARGFAAMAKGAPNETLRQLYTFFYAEEQRHANAEMALMKRWGMLEGDTLPEPSNNIRLAVAWMQNYADDMPYHVMGTVIPALEVALDGALCQFLLDTVDDPVCHAAFDKINDDESRHLGVGFTVMEMHGHSPQSIEAVRMMGRLLKPQVLLGLAVHFPLLNKMRDNVVKAGLPEEKLYAAMAKFEKIGGRTGNSRKNLLFRAISGHNKIMADRTQKLYHIPVDLMVKVTDLIPQWALPAKPGWVGDVTWKPTD
ncbi:ferritin-like domain-containing protein [Isoalcanivorax indicus]|uniref:ferritin-like domain-containing protein n=1 Tax=Isoalcanivorax indicus TaxID=2202653 RepID=UPI000DB99D78|nr:ferritin-like domain-containing protein [Isoalcanivorax indicus]